MNLNYTLATHLIVSCDRTIVFIVKKKKNHDNFSCCHTPFILPFTIVTPEGDCSPAELKHHEVLSPFAAAHYLSMKDC